MKKFFYFLFILLCIFVGLYYFQRDTFNTFIMKYFESNQVKIEIEDKDKDVDEDKDKEGTLEEDDEEKPDDSQLNLSKNFEDAGLNLRFQYPEDWFVIEDQGLFVQNERSSDDGISDTLLGFYVGFDDDMSDMDDFFVAPQYKDVKKEVIQGKNIEITLYTFFDMDVGEGATAIWYDDDWRYMASPFMSLGRENQVKSIDALKEMLPTMELISVSSAQDEEEEKKEEEEKPTVTTEPLEGEMEVRVNTNPESNVALVATAPNGESMTMITRSEGDMEYVDMILITTSEGEKGTITIGDDGKPSLFEINDHVLQFLNYTDETVDIYIEYPDKPDERLEKVPLNFPEMSDNAVYSFIPIAKANLGSTSPYKGVSKGAQPSEKAKEYFSVATLALNVVSCTVATGLTIASGTLLAPLAYLGCGALVLRGGVYVWQSIPCTGTKEEIIECAHKEAESKMRHGPIFNGFVRDTKTNEEIPYAVVQVRRSDGTIITSAVTNEQGAYKLDGIYADAYFMTVVAPAYLEKKFAIIVQDYKVEITNMENDKVIAHDTFQTGRYKYDYRLNLTLEPEGFFDGTWEGRANNTAPVTDCGGANFTFIIQGESLKGVARADNDYDLDMVGKVQENGEIEAGSATGDYDTALFKGTLNSKSDSGFGIWGSAEGCEGDWTVKRVKEEE